MRVRTVVDVRLAEARSKAAECRQLVAKRIDPIEARKAGIAQEALQSSRAVTFKDCADRYIRTHRSDWKNAKHTWQWEHTITTLCDPVFGSLPVQDVDTGLVLRVLEPLWTQKPETASRLRGRIERVLDWATARGYRSGENPARWRGHLDNLLPKMERRKRIKHHPALPFVEMGAFVSDLRTQDGVAARALEFTILTAARTGEVINALWSEFDLDAALLWTVPAERMKAHREHRVSLSAQAMKVLRAMEKQRRSDHVFPGLRKDQPLSNMAMLKVLERMGRDDLTTHGFRSSFRDWASERTSFPREVCEMALAHVVSDQVEAAYRRGDLFEKRRQLMDAWAKFCDTQKAPANVVPMKRKEKPAGR